MARLVRIRDVPEPVYRILKSRATRSGMSLSAYLRRELARIASLPTPEELAALSAPSAPQLSQRSQNKP